MLKRFNKTFSWMLVLSIILGQVSMPNIFAATVPAAKNGVLDIEAEKTSYAKTNLSVKSDKVFSGGQGLSVIAETKEQPAVDAQPDIDLSFQADKEGTYTIWLRSAAKQENDGGNSIYLSLDGAAYKYTKIGGEPGIPQWLSIGTVKAAGAGKTVSVKIKTRHRFEIVFDRFIITADANYKPDDALLGLQSASPKPSATPSTAPTKSAAPAASQKPSLVPKDGYIMVEAENLKYNPDNYNLVTGEDMSEGKGLQTANEDKTVPDINSAPDIDLSFKADQDGTYAIWVRNKSNGTDGGNSIFLSLDGGAYKYTIIGGTPTEFAWTKLGTVTVSAGGTSSVKLTRRQRYNIVLDKFVISNNKIYTPSGMGGDPNSIEAVKLPDNVYPKPEITPPAEHPRLMFTAKDIPVIKANFETEQNKPAYEAWKKSIETKTDGKLPPPKNQGSSNYNASVLTAIEGLAFDHAINGNEESGKNAVLAMRNFAYDIVFDNASLAYRYKGHVIFTIAQVYDWCYDLLGKQDKLEFIALAESIANGLDIGYPPKGQGAVSGHGGENNLLRDLLSLGIATYDERPDIYNFCAGRILTEYVPARNYMYTSHSHSQGNAYGAYRGGWEIWSAWLFKRMSGQDIYSADQQYFPYEWLYIRRPDGQALRIGDDYWEASGSGSYWSGWASTLFLVSNYYDNPYLKREYTREAPLMSAFTTNFSLFTPVTMLVFNNPKLDGKPTTQLPLTKYFPSAKGTMIARTGWNDGKSSSDVLAMMNIGERYGANHAHLDAGNFQLYYKGILASDSGLYSDGNGTEHAYNYVKRGIAHNTLTIYDPNEQYTFYKKPAINDGGLRFPGDALEPTTLEKWLDPSYETGKVLGQEFGPDPMVPEFTYIKGDITKAYSDKVKEVLRSMLFMPLEDADHPAVLIVMDKVEASNPALKKSWLLHMQEEPKVEGNKTIVTRTQKGYNGRMVVETLLPKASKIEVIGGEGKQFWVVDKNYPPAKLDLASGDSEGAAWGRIEVSPSTPSKTDYFLNVMTVSDADTKAADLQSTLIEGDNFVGAVVSDRVAIFGKDASRIESSIKFTIPGTGNFKIFVSGLKEGTWITGNGQEVIVTKDGGAAYCTADAGEVALTYKNAQNIRKSVTPVVDEADHVSIRINKTFVYSDVKPVVVEGRTLVPMRVIFENLGAEVAWDEATKTATATKDGIVIKITEDSKTAYVGAEAKELDVAATVIEGRFVVPVRFVSEAMGAKVVWDPFANLVDITPGSVKPKPVPIPEGYAKIVNSSTSAESETFYATNSWDNNYDTLWSAQGEHWVVYEFDQAYSISSVELMLNQNAGRNAIFEVQYSMDGSNFISIYSGTADGKTPDNVFEIFKFPNTVTTRYIKYIAKGSNKSMWNGLKEIRFKLN